MNSKKDDKSSKLTFRDAAIATTLLGFAAKTTDYADLIEKAKKENGWNKCSNIVFLLGIAGLLACFVSDLNKKWLNKIFD